MAFISSMTETEKFQRFKEHLRHDNFEGVRKTFEPEFMEEIIDDFFVERPIHLACQKGNFEIVKLLIENKCNIESETKNGLRPIHFVSWNGNYKIVKLLIENTCNIESEDKDGWRSIHWACRYGNFKIVKLLIENKCNIECETNWEWKPIHLACEKGNFEIVKLLIENKCNIESETEKGRRPIHLACLDGHKNIVKLLIVQNCFINSRDNNGRTPLDLAKSNGHEEIIPLLFVETQINDSILKNDNKSCKTFFKNKKVIEKEKLVVVKEIELEKRSCGVCLDREVDSVFECGHTICESCSYKIVRCPFCKREPVHAKRIYFN